MSLTPTAPVPTRITLSTLARMAQRREPFACLTCYDATTARFLARGGVHVLLVGDTAAEMVLGLPRTIDMPLDVLIALTAGVKRGAPDVVVMADMPFLSYQADDAEGVRNAGRFVRDGLADIVKIEADERFAGFIEKVVRAGVPVCGHIGSRPQTAAMTGGYAAAGRTAESAQALVRDALALEHAGCSMLLVEAVPPETADQILAATKLPVIGIGAGTACHGQVLVLQDLVGMTERPPRFADPVADLGAAFTQAARTWTDRVARREIGGKPYTMKPAPGSSTPTSPVEPIRNGHDDGSRPDARPGNGVASVRTSGKAGAPTDSPKNRSRTTARR